MTLSTIEHGVVGERLALLLVCSGSKGVAGAAAAAAAHEDVSGLQKRKSAVLMCNSALHHLLACIHTVAPAVGLQACRRSLCMIWPMQRI